MVDYLGVGLLLAWTAGVWCFLSVLGARAGLVRTALWAGILLIPIIGVVAWFLFGPRTAR